MKSKAVVLRLLETAVEFANNVSRALLSNRLVKEAFITQVNTIIDHLKNILKYIDADDLIYKNEVKRRIETMISKLTSILQNIHTMAPKVMLEILNKIVEEYESLQSLLKRENGPDA